jgi:hypothetical protein
VVNDGARTQREYPQGYFNHLERPKNVTFASKQTKAPTTSAAGVFRRRLTAYPATDAMACNVIG